MEKEILRDESLEALKLIKEIDTLAIIKKADETGKKKETLRIKIILAIIGMIFISFNLVTLYLCGITFFLIIESLIIWISPIFLFTLVKKHYI
jgi:hypothetical protein